MAKNRNQRPSKRGGDGLTDRERAFVERRRADPVAAGWEICEQAGYLGDKQKLTERARVLMRKPLVAAAVMAPAAPEEEETDDTLKADIRRRLRSILRSDSTSIADKIKAADKLLATIPGGYVPVQVHTKGTLTLEGWVASMGGRPGDEEDLELTQPALPAPQEKN